MEALKIALTSVVVNNPNEAQVLQGGSGLRQKDVHSRSQSGNSCLARRTQWTGLLLEPNDNPIGKTFQEALYKQELAAIVWVLRIFRKSMKDSKDWGWCFVESQQKRNGEQALLDDTCGNLIQIHQI
jgi:hypothetical protein